MELELNMDTSQSQEVKFSFLYTQENANINLFEVEDDILAQIEEGQDLIISSISNISFSLKFKKAMKMKKPFSEHMIRRLKLNSKTFQIIHLHLNTKATKMTYKLSV